MKTSDRDELIIEDKLDSDGDVRITIIYEDVWVNKEEAKEIIQCLTNLFKL